MSEPLDSEMYPYDDPPLVPVLDVWDDSIMHSRPRKRRYDWAGIAHKALEKPGHWLLIDEEGAPSTVGNINQRLLSTITKIGDEKGFTFKARSSETRTIIPDDGTAPRKVAKIWVVAILD